MSARAHPLLPFAAALAGVGFLSLMDAFMKEAALLIGAYTATVLRAGVGTALIAPVWLARGPAMPTRAVWKLHLTRGVVSAFMALAFFFALTRLPLAEAIALSFIAPLIALYLASVLLGETISRAAIGASLLGFAGTLVIVGGRIGQGQFDEGAALGVASLTAQAPPADEFVRLEPVVQQALAAAAPFTVTIETFGGTRQVERAEGPMDGEAPPKARPRPVPKPKL